MLPFRPSISSVIGHPRFLLGLTTLFWGGNVVAARLAVGEISPMILVGLRWVIVSAVLFIFAGRQVVEALRILRPHWRFVLPMGAIGFTISNATLYEGARFTSGVNVAIIQGILPVLVLGGASIMWGVRIGPVRMVGVVATILGILSIAAHGDLVRLTSLQFNIGDLLVLLGTVTYAGYTMALRKRPPIPAFAFFVGVAVAATITSVPAVALEVIAGKAIWPGTTGLLVLLYVAICASVAGQLFWIRAVEMIGPGRTVVFQNLVPIIGAFLSVLLLREDFHWFHALSLALVLGGLFMSEGQSR